MSKMIFPSYQFDLDGLHVLIRFQEFGYSYVVPVVYEMRPSIGGGRWEQVSNTYWNDPMEIQSFVRGDDSRRKEFARKAAEKWREYRKGWEISA